MADFVFLLKRHFCEGHIMAVRYKHRIVPVPQSTTDRPHHRSIDLAFKDLFVPIRPDQRQGADEMASPDDAVTSRY